MAIFLLALVTLFLVSSVIGGWVRDSRLNALDRSLGMLAGLATSLILLAGAYVVAENIWPGNKQPSVIQEAKVTPMIRAGALLLNGFLPKGFKILDAEAVGTVTDKTKEAVKKRVFERLVRPDTPKSRDEERPGYDTKERNSLERAIDRLNQSTHNKTNAFDAMITTHPFRTSDDDHFHEECGVFGVFGHKDAAAHAALGLHALQHRARKRPGS